MSAPTDSTPWYEQLAPRGLTDDYVHTLTTGGDLRMLKLVKAIRVIIVNVCVAVIAGYSLYLGADPTVIGGFALAIFGGYNGIELADLAALLQAYTETTARVDTNEE